MWEGAVHVGGSCACGGSGACVIERSGACDELYAVAGDVVFGCQ